MLCGHNFYFKHTKKGWKMEKSFDRNAPAPRATDWYMTKGTVVVHQNTNQDRAISFFGTPDDVESFKKSKLGANWELLQTHHQRLAVEEKP